MLMWIRLAAAVLVTLAGVALLECFASGLLFGGRSAEEMQEAAHGRASRELFWFLIFWAVMATAVLAAVRRWLGHARRLVALPASKRRDVA